MDELRKKIQVHKQNVHLREQYFNSAVLITLTHVQDELCFVFQKRSDHLNRNPGEICFPGGKIEEEEWDSPDKTAIRETMEELGVNLEDIELLGDMNHLINTAGVLVYAYIGYLSSVEKCKFNTQEVQKLIMIPVQHFIDHKPEISHLELQVKPSKNFPMHYIPLSYEEKWKSQSVKYPVYFYRYHNDMIWGLTASLVYEFIQLFYSTDSTL